MSQKFRQTDAALAIDFVRALEQWGMSREKAKSILTIGLGYLNDSTFRWRDLSAANLEETARFMAEHGGKETKQ